MDETIVVALPEDAVMRVSRHHYKNGHIDRTPRARRERDEKIRQMANEGYSESDIATAVGLTVEGVRLVMRKRLGMETLWHSVAVKTLDADRVMESIVVSAEPSSTAIATIDWDELDTAKLADWQARLTAAIREWTLLRNKLRRIPRGANAE